MINRVFKYLRLEQNISEPRTDYDLLLEKTIALSPFHGDCPDTPHSRHGHVRYR